MRLDGRILLLLVGALFVTSFARYIDVANNSPNYRRSNPILAAREDGDECRAICSFKTTCCIHGPKKGRRDPELYNLETNSNIRPRVLQAVTGSAAKTAYVIQMTNDPNTIQVYTSATGVSNSAVFRDLRGANAVKIGLVNLCGCTALLVVNPDAVYFAHYFEDLSFQANPDDPPADFQTNVINFLNSGLGGYPGLAQHANLFNNADTRIYIMTPRKNARTHLYNNEITLLKATLNTILPNVQAPAEFSYRPLNIRSNTDAQLMDTTALGRALFEWDPNGGTPQTRVWLQDMIFGES